MDSFSFKKNLQCCVAEIYGIRRLLRLPIHPKSQKMSNNSPGFHSYQLYPFPASHFTPPPTQFTSGNVPQPQQTPCHKPFVTTPTSTTYQSIPHDTQDLNRTPTLTPNHQPTALHCTRGSTAIAITLCLHCHGWRHTSRRANNCHETLQPNSLPHLWHWPL